MALVFVLFTMYTGGKVALELRVEVKTAEFVIIKWNLGDFDEYNVLLWIVNYRTAYVCSTVCCLLT